MKASPKMKAIVQELIAQHNLELGQVGRQYCLESPGFDCLTLARISRCCIAVAHCFEVGNSQVLEPEVVFFVGMDGEAWIPIEITHSLTGWSPVAVLTQDGTRIHVYDRGRQARLARFTELWAENLRAQGWLAAGIHCIEQSVSRKEK